MSNAPPPGGRSELNPRVKRGGCPGPGGCAYPGHLDPVLHHPGPVAGRHAPVPEAGGDDAVGHAVELGDGGAHGGGQVLLALLVPLGPDAAQAVVGDHLLEQLLEGAGGGSPGSAAPQVPPRPQPPHTQEEDRKIFFEVNFGSYPKDIIRIY